MKDGKKGETEIIGFASFYTLPSTVMHHPNYKSIKAAYAFYSVGTDEVSLLDIMQDILIVAKNVSPFKIYVLLRIIYLIFKIMF